MMAVSTEKILCIEDDSETAALIAEDLQERGYAVTLALDGHAGLKAALRIAPALVLHARDDGIRSARALDRPGAAV